MVEHFRPVKLDDGRFHYLCLSEDSETAYAYGYCGGWPAIFDDPTNNPANLPEKYVSRERVRALPNRDKYHTDGHKTAGEAMTCAFMYDLDNCLKVSEKKGLQKPCELCGEHTTHYAYFDTPCPRPEYTLCKKHDSKQCVIDALALREQKADDERAMRRKEQKL